MTYNHWSAAQESQPRENFVLGIASHIELKAVVLSIMRLIVPIAIAASYLVCSGHALPTIDNQKAFLPKINDVNVTTGFQLENSTNQKYNGHQLIAINANNEQELSALYALREVGYSLIIDNLPKSDVNPLYVII